MADDEGVLGNLPKSRPGKRSAKRAGRPAKAAAGRPAKAAAKAAVKAEAAGTPAAKPPRTARTTAAKRGSGDRVEVGHEIHAEAQREPTQPSGDPLSAVVRTAAGLTVTGVRVAGAVTQELLRRLPRP
jgi:hypothetical protein